jgi:hypothetical protein
MYCDFVSYLAPYSPFVAFIWAEAEVADSTNSSVDLVSITVTWWCLPYPGKISTEAIDINITCYRRLL